jgi:hypothetical protein
MRWTRKNGRHELPVERTGRRIVARTLLNSLRILGLNH